MILERLEFQNKKLNFVDFLRVIINMNYVFVLIIDIKFIIKVQRMVVLPYNKEFPLSLNCN